MRILPRRRPRVVVVLGCGPAGLFAAHAAERCGMEVRIFSKGPKSEMFGAQYLHALIPELPVRSATIDYWLQGTVEGYARKVYGDRATLSEDRQFSVSPESLQGRRRVWDIRAAYDGAWDRFGHRVQPAEISGEWILEQRLAGGELHGATVISSVPLPAICIDGRHQFKKAQIWASGDAPELDQWCPVGCPPDTVICNGRPEPSWYRVSNIFGHTTAEWPLENKPPINPAAVSKPISNTCDCFTGARLVGSPVLRVGRYGTWKKGVLAHEAYDLVMSLNGGL